MRAGAERASWRVREESVVTCPSVLVPSRVGDEPFEFAANAFANGDNISVSEYFPPPGLGSTCMLSGLCLLGGGNGGLVCPEEADEG